MRRTTHPHGLELISGDWMWIRDGREAEQGSYRSCVEARGFRFARLECDNVDVMTPAQQLLWRRDPSDPYGNVVLSPWIRRWLETEVGARGPDWYAREAAFDLLFVGYPDNRVG